MDWLKKLTGGAESEEEQASFSSIFGGAVMLDLAPLAKKSPVLLKDAVRYVLKGEPEEVLLKLRGDQTLGGALGLLCLTNQYGGDKKRPILAKIDLDKPACYMRLMRIYEAVAAPANPGRLIRVPGVSHWLDLFIQEATGMRGYGTCKFSPEVTAVFVEKMLEAAGEPVEMMVRACFLLDPTEYTTSNTIKTITSLKGFHVRLSYHVPAVMEALNHPEHRQRLQALGILFNDDVDYTPFREKITQLACSSAKTVREEAQKIIIRKPSIFLERITRLLCEGDNEERLQAVRLYAQLDPEKAGQYLAERLRVETAPKVKAAIEGVLAEPALSTGQEENPAESGELDFEPVPEVESYAPLPGTIEQDLKQLIHNYNETAKNFNATHHKEKYFYKMDIASESLVKEAFDLMQNLVVKKETHPLWKINFYRANKFEKELKAIIAKPEIKLVHLFRLLILINDLQWNENWFHLGFGEQLIQYFFQSHSLPFDARSVSAGARATGIGHKVMGWYFLESYSLRLQVIRRPQEYWKFYAEHRDILEEALGFRPATRAIPTYWEREVKIAAFHVLTAFPQPPAAFQAKLWTQALEGPKNERALAQQCLSKVPGREKRIIDALKDGRQEIRSEAARWLAELRWSPAIPELKQALKKEKSDLTKGALMEALESLGVPVDDFLDRATLKKEAESALGKGVPAQLQWFPFDVLPAVRWESGEKVEPAVVKWLILLSFKLGSPEPTPAIRKYCQYMNSADRRELGRYILQAWLTQDTIPRYTLETATPEAKSRAKQIKQWYPDRTEDQLFQEILHSLLTECFGSAIKEKGLLTIPAACSGPEIVPLVEAYLKKWYGHRVHQCRALVQMLSWNEHPLAIQLLLSVANRFRTKGIQEQANQCVNELAERLGWTLDELADRTIPTAGFDEKGVLILDFGPRKFLCRLDDDLEIGTFNEEGKQIKNLPDAGKGDDQELAKEAKKVLSEAKKILKQALRLQRERLYENMCTQRSWRFADLRQFLFEHPIISRYCRRLVWAQVENEKTMLTFRLMEDRSLTDLEDRTVTPPDGAMIKLAHSCNLDLKTAAAWVQHFTDYKVEPLFEQFGKTIYTPTEMDRENDQIDGYMGYLMDNFKLRGMMVKLGYTRGQAEDGGFFYQYKKRFPGLGLEAVIEFSGIPLPEENVRVALKSLYFLKIIVGEAGGYFNPDFKVPLMEIPTVLFNECWNDLRRLAGASDGFDPDWEKKVEY